MALETSDVFDWLSIKDATQRADGEDQMARVLAAVIEHAEETYSLPDEYTPKIEQALIMQASRYWKRKSTVEGVMNFGPEGGAIRIGQFDPDIDRLMTKYQVWNVS
jgi:hypothetical protein